MTIIVSGSQNLIFNILTAFNIASRETPTSAKTASHMVAKPKPPKTRTINLTENANTIFCMTTCLVALAILIEVAILDG